MKKIIIMFCGLLISFSADANVDKTLIQNAEKYLNSISGLQGGFVQNANGKTE